MDTTPPFCERYALDGTLNPRVMYAPSRGHVHNWRGRVHSPGGRVHNSRGRVYSSRGRVHSSRGRIRNSRGRVHSSGGRVRNWRGHVHSWKGRDRGSRRRVQSTRGSGPIWRGRRHPPSRRVNPCQGRGPHTRGVAQFAEARRRESGRPALPSSFPQSLLGTPAAGGLSGPRPSLGGFGHRRGCSGAEPHGPTHRTRCTPGSWPPSARQPRS
jgi:hypothetical protein